MSALFFWSGYQVRGLTKVAVRSEEEALAQYFQGDQVGGTQTWSEAAWQGILPMIIVEPTVL